MRKFILAAGFFLSAAALVALPVFAGFALSSFGTTIVFALICGGIVCVIL